MIVITQEQKNETTIPNTESALRSAASNDDRNEIEMLTMSNKRPIHEDSSEEDPLVLFQQKKAATGWAVWHLCAKREGRRRSTKDLCLPCQRSSA